MLQIKIMENQISYKKLVGSHVYLPAGVELGAPKIAMLEIFLCTEMGK